VHSTKIRGRLLWAVGFATLAACAALLFFQLGDQPVFGDETLYLKVAGKTLQTGRWVPLLGRPYAFVEKPPLTVWGAALGMGLAGRNELGSRWVNGVVALLLCALTARFALRAGNLWTMALAPLLLISAPGLLLEHGLRMALPETWLLLAVTAGCYWFLASEHRSLTVRLAGLAAISLFAGWTKGLIGPLVLGATIFLVEIVAPRREPGAEAPPPPQRRLSQATASAVAATVPGLLLYFGWLVYSLASVDAALAFVQRDILGRTTGSHDPLHLQPFAIYLLAAWRNFGILALAGPLLLLVKSRKDDSLPDEEGHRERRLHLTLLFWVVSVFVLFGIPQSRLAWYSYPAYPALALAAALVLDRLRALLRNGLGAFGGLGPRVGTAAFVLLLSLLFALRAEALVRAWPSRDERSLMALQRRLDADPAARAFVEQGLVQGEHARLNVAEWHRFYLRNFVELERRQLPAEAPACSFVVTSDPEAWRPLVGEQLAGVAPVAAANPRFIPLFVLDLCGGRFAGGAS
jgi:4-amino-4-deoxy-L-arabinose transferase-like glycosyltransferase